MDATCNCKAINGDKEAEDGDSTLFDSGRMKQKVLQNIHESSQHYALERFPISKMHIVCTAEYPSLHEFIFILWTHRFR